MRPRNPEQARAKAERQREAAARGGVGKTPPAPHRTSMTQKQRNHCSSPAQMRAQKDGERKAREEWKQGLL